MTRKIFRPLFAIALALGMAAAFSTPGSAALSTADRPVAGTTAPALTQEAATVTAAVTPAPVATPAAAVAAAPVKPAATARAAKPARKPIASRVAPRHAFAASPRGGYGYRCH